MTFTTSMDQIVRKKTVAVFVIFTIVTLPNLFHSSDRWIWYIGFFSFFMLLLLMTFLHKPLKYEVGNNKIIIHRLIGSVALNIQDIARVDRIHHDLLKNSSKGGAFGYFGKFNTDLGKIRFYATRRDRLVMLTNHDKTKIILTPDHIDDFIEDVETKASSQQKYLQKQGLTM